MPEPRPAQLYSQLLDDRRILDAATEANEPPSLVVHLFEKEWTICTGRAANKGPPPRRFPYSLPISSILDDIQARRVPVEFADIFKTMQVKFFEGCLIVEMHDSRPVKSGTTKTIETKVDKYVLRPGPEIMWDDIREAVQEQNTWGDKEALELEARLVLSIAPPLCLDPSPTINKTINAISRSGAYPKTSFKRKQSEETDDDAELVRRRKIMQIMNPRSGKSFNPGYNTLRYIERGIAKRSITIPGEAKGPAPQATAQGSGVRSSNVPNIPPAATNNPSAATRAANITTQSQAQAAQFARQRLSQSLARVPPEARQAALNMASQKIATAQRAQIAQNQIAGAQAQTAQAQTQAMAQVQAQMRGNQLVPEQSQQVSSAMQNVPQAQQPVLNNGNPASVSVKNERDVQVQLSALQNSKPSFPLTLPQQMKRPPTAPPPPSPPKPNIAPTPAISGASSATPNPGQVPIPGSDIQTAQQTPRMQSSTPVNGMPINLATQPGMQPVQPPQPQQPQSQQPVQTQNTLASYHQGIVAGQQNQMQQMHTTAEQGYGNVAGNAMRGIAGNGIAMGIGPGFHGQLQNAYSAAGMNMAQRTQQPGIGLGNGLPQNLASYQAALQQQQRINMAGQVGTQGMQIPMQQTVYQGMQQQHAAHISRLQQLAQSNPVLRNQLMQKAHQMVEEIPAPMLSTWVASKERDFEALKSHTGWARLQDNEKALRLAYETVKQQWMSNTLRNQLQGQAIAQGNVPRQ